tara:strand:- start:1718 stop:2176 length:459 start_codon:yes stop_codon:yes gene_type:complete
MEVKPQPVLVTSSEMKKIKNAIEDVKSNGGLIRSIFENYNEPNSSVEWEVDAAVECFQMFSSRWTIEILAALYIAGDRRFNEMRGLLKGISSRTLSDKLGACQKSGLVDRIVEEGPPVRVTYKLTEHGLSCGRLLGPLIGYMKIHKGLVREL